MTYSSVLCCSSRNILDDFREAYYWLRQNTPEDATVMSWWDYGYQIAGKESSFDYVMRYFVDIHEISMLMMVCM